MLLCISYGATESPRRQRWAFSAEHPATHTQRSRPWQAAERAPTSASQRTHERTRAWECCREGLSLRPRTPPSSSSTPCPTVTHTQGFIFLIKTSSPRSPRTKWMLKHFSVCTAACCIFLILSAGGSGHMTPRPLTPVNLGPGQHATCTTPALGTDGSTTPFFL